MPTQHGKWSAEQSADLLSPPLGRRLAAFFIDLPGVLVVATIIHILWLALDPSSYD